ncbi:hypothetical protein CRE_05794 [Caenorhabditis remanei]|uniref:T20D4.11-like domain-containing protein n=1 Tax=Caenorhabditis remanei TaxID=31234 RepID=E3M048_CAERE|nr:hypothetical protein CRE_05794 [Caenorhabditis remanei]
MFQNPLKIQIVVLLIGVTITIPAPCSRIFLYVAVSCDRHQQSFSSKFGTNSFNNEYEMKEFKTSCDYVDTCYNTFGPCKHLSSIPEKTWNMKLL